MKPSGYLIEFFLLCRWRNCQDLEWSYWSLQHMHFICKNHIQMILSVRYIDGIPSPSGFPSEFLRFSRYLNKDYPCATKENLRLWNEFDAGHICGELQLRLTTRCSVARRCGFRHNRRPVRWWLCWRATGCFAPPTTFPSTWRWLRSIWPSRATTTTRASSSRCWLTFSPRSTSFTAPSSPSRRHLHCSLLPWAAIAERCECFREVHSLVNFCPIHFHFWNPFLFILTT